MSAKSYVERELLLGNNTPIMKEIQEEVNGRIRMFKAKLRGRMEEYYGENK